MLIKQPHNSGVHIDSIVLVTTCTKHKVGEGEPCWTVWLGTSQRFAPAICNNRVKRAGFNGRISASSISQNLPKQLRISK